MDKHEQDCTVEPLEKPLDRTALNTAHVAYLGVRGMGCPRCALRVRNGLLRLDGVLMAEVFLAKGIAAAAYDPSQLTPSALVRAVAAAGNDGRHHYQAHLMMVTPAAVAFSL